MGINRKSIFSLHRTMWQGRNVWSERCPPFSRNLINVPPNCANKARNLRHNVLPCVPHTIWRCFPKLASAPEWKTTQGISMAVSRARRRIRYWISSLTISYSSLTSHMLPCHRSEPCTKAMPVANARWSNMAFVCLRRWTTDRSNGRNSRNASARRYICRQRRATTNLV